MISQMQNHKRADRQIPMRWLAKFSIVFGKLDVGSAMVLDSDSDSSDVEDLDAGQHVIGMVVVDRLLSANSKTNDSFADGGGGILDTSARVTNSSGGKARTNLNVFG